VGLIEVLAPAKCIRSFAPNAVMNAKSHSNQLRADLFTVENVSLRREDIKIRYHILR
jgi:hypothetical protein